ncbi:MAG TPA: ATP-dependent DNA helicase UvrD2 [Actinomycetales bacterium]|nr:ATP-dependent DNA helicase UvrD2 [Actinomycetales bacterium]
MATAEKILSALDEDQREVALALRGPVCVLAGAGTGKTRAITHRIAYGVETGVYKPTSVLALTFTARAAGEMRSRLRTLGVVGVQARTFHAAALRQVQYFYPQAVGGSVPQLLEHKAQLVAHAAGMLHLDVDRATLRDLAAEIEWAKVNMLTPDQYVKRVEATARPGVAGVDLLSVSRLMRRYEEEKTDRYLIDFEDVLLFLVGWLQSRPDVAAQVREQYRHFVVDEYQDVSPLQQRLLDLWLGGREELCVVGDAHQTIYSFTGASPEFLLGFSRRYSDAQTVKLTRDYRSTPQVVRIANDIIKRGRPTHSAGLTLQAQRPSGPEPEFATYDDDVAEAGGVVKRIGDLLKQGIKASEIAILFRTNAQSAAFETALANAGIGYVVRGGERFFARRDVREAIVLLRAASRTTPASVALGEAVRETLKNAGWSEEPPASSGAVREKWDALQALVALADDLTAQMTQPPTMETLITELDDRANAQHAPTIEGVTLASLHAAKGLEWDAVFLVGLSEGLMPISLAEGEEAVEEERRLLYVGVTRARMHLVLSWARARNPGSRASRKLSRFLDGIWPQPRGGTGVRRARECTECGGPLISSTERKRRRCASCPANYDENLFEALRTWRGHLARETSKPAFTILADATLEEVAHLRPKSAAELIKIRGIGPRKLEQFGEDLLTIVNDHLPR